MNTNDIINNLKTYINLQLDNMSQTTPVISFMKPLITRALDKNFNKVTKVFDLIADKDGNVDIENILLEMIDNIVNTQPFIINTSFIGDIEIGGGYIKLNLPLTNKKLVFDTSDLEAFKDMIINKN